MNGAVIKWIGLVAGPIAAVGAYALLGGDGDLGEAGRRTTAVAVLMAVWWLTEALPLSATALLPIALFPMLGVVSIRQATAPYAHELIFLFLGGFILGLGMQRWGLHRRIALLTVMLVGTKPRRLVLGFMVATAVMSMWVSNTATAVMMMPIAMSVIGLVFAKIGKEFDPGMERDQPGPNLATSLMLGVAYGASIGGLGTLIGTPPNLVLASQAREIFGQTIGFAQWMWLGIPLVLIFLPLAWAYLVFIAFPVKLRELPGGKEMIRGELRGLGPMNRGEWTVLIVFLSTALAWIFHRPVADAVGFYSEAEVGGVVQRAYYLTDEGIAITAALLLFLIPVDVKKRVFAMDWETAERLPWGILLLFGGGLSLAGAMTATEVDTFIAARVTAVGVMPDLVLILIVVAVMIFLTELTSNTAVATAFLPILAASAVGLGMHPYLLMIPAAMAASCAFMLPVATPPNAIVFSSGYVTLPQMAKAGVWLNLTGIVLITLFVYFFGGALLGIDLGTAPDWARRGE